MSVLYYSVLAPVVFEHMEEDERAKFRSSGTQRNVLPFLRQRRS